MLEAKERLGAGERIRSDDEDECCYVLARSDLSAEMVAVQAAHAAWLAGQAAQGRASPFLALLGVASEDALIKAAEDLSRKQIKFEMFFEPDNGLGHTALATEPLRGERRKGLKKYQAWKKS